MLPSARIAVGDGVDPVGASQNPCLRLQTATVAVRNLPGDVGSSPGCLRHHTVGPARYKIPIETKGFSLSTCGLVCFFTAHILL